MKKLLLNAIKSYLAISIFLCSCASSGQKTIDEKKSLVFQKAEMDRALIMCHNAFLIEKPSYGSEDFWQKFDLAKSNAGYLWKEYEGKSFKSFYKDNTSKNVRYTLAGFVGIFSFGILSIPVLTIPSKLDGAYPSYEELINFCESKKSEFLARKEIENKKKKEREEKLKAQIEQEKKWEVEEKRARERESKIIKERKLQKQETDNYAKTLGYGGGVSYGIISTISKITSGSWSRGNAANYLIARNGYDDFRVKNIIDDYVIFSAFRNYDLIQIAVIKDGGEDYITNSILKGRYFAVVGKQTFTTTFGQNMEVLVFKKVE